jgi:putative acetyltransferase
MKVKIRRARPADAVILAAAERELAKTPGRLTSRSHELKAANFRRAILELSSEGAYLVAVEHGRIVGHALLRRMEREANAHVRRLTIMVHEGHQGRGIGTALLKRLMSWARKAPGVEKIELGVRTVNRGAVRLYKRLGFRVEGRLRKHLKLTDGSTIDDFAMGWFPRK